MYMERNLSNIFLLLSMIEFLMETFSSFLLSLFKFFLNSLSLSLPSDNSFSNSILDLSPTSSSLCKCLIKSFKLDSYLNKYYC